MKDETEKQSKKNETGKETETQSEKKETEKQTERQSNKETEKQSEKKKETERQTPSKQKETEPKKNRETEKKDNEFLEASLKTGKTSENTGLAKQTESSSSKKETEAKAAGVKQTENAASASETKSTETEKKKPETETEQSTESVRQTEKITEAVESETKKTPFRAVNDVIIVRQEANVDSGRIATLYPGEKVLQVSGNSEWSEIRFASADEVESGYVKTEFLTDAEKLYTAKEKVNVREKTDADSEKFGAYLEGDPVLVEEQLSNGWSQVRYLAQEKAEVVDGYVRSEYLEKAENNENDLLAAEAAAFAGETETEAQTTDGTEAETMPETVAETESEAVTETGAEATESPAETETQTELSSESETSAETETESETTAITESETELVTEEAAETTEESTESETETITEAVTETKTETDTEAGENVAVATPQAQFAALKETAPEAARIGILYAKNNTAAASELEEYETLTSSLGYELQSVCVEEAQDIDFAASDLVGEVDAILCIPDSMIEELLDTVHAYAQEAEIPVIDVDGTVVSK